MLNTLRRIVLAFGCGLFATFVLAESDESIFFTTAQVSLSTERPAWLTEALRAPAGEQRDWVLVSAGPYRTQAECQSHLAAEVKKEADAFLAQHLGSSRAPRLLNYSGETYLAKLRQPTRIHAETVNVSFGKMEQLHVQLEFTESFLREAEQRWRQWRQASRLAYVGVGAGFVIALLTVGWGFFKRRAMNLPVGQTNLLFRASVAILVVVAVAVSRCLVLL